MGHANKTLPGTLSKYSFLIPVMMISCFIINPLSTLKTSAQETKKPVETKKPAAQLSEKEWKAVEGIFQNAQNKEMNVQFSAGENVLIAKLLWNNNEIHLTPESALIFSSSQEGNQDPITITFSKDPAGAVNTVNVANNGVWNRTKDYQQTVKKEMDHTPAQLMPFEGLYYFQNEKDRFIEFSVKENKLVLKQQWDGNEISFVPETPVDFFSKDAPLFSLSFTKDNAGNVTQVLAFKRDLWIKVNKSVPTAAQLKACEGKYQLIDDPDNYIQIMAKDDNLVVKQLWDGKEIIFEAKTETFFYNKEQSIPLLILKDNNGAVVQVKLLENDLFNKVK
jgi:hypothetical protein